MNRMHRISGEQEVELTEMNYGNDKRRIGQSHSVFGCPEGAL